MFNLGNLGGILLFCIVSTLTTKGFEARMEYTPAAKILAKLMASSSCGVHVS